MLKRSAKQKLKTALKISPVVLLSGARQIGKSTLSLELFKDNYLTFDDGDLKLQAKDNPKGLLKQLKKPICLDEIQKVPDLLEYIKMEVDSFRENGMFLLTGSANILDNKEVKDTLAGRVVEITLHPFSTRELHGKNDENIVDNLFNGSIFNTQFQHKQSEYFPKLLNQILSGGYPEIIKLKNPTEQMLWFSSYISTYIERDARNLGEIRDIDNFIRFVNIISTRSANLINKSNLSKTVGVTTRTIENYLGILQRIYQGYLIKPYYENFGKQFTKSPKFFLSDTGILSHFLKIYSTQELINSSHYGAILETFIFSELLKYCSYSNSSIELYHYRTSDNKEIDFILKNGDNLIAVEIKSSASINKKHFKHIIDLQQQSSYSVMGIVFYTGDYFMEIDEQLIAIPMSIFV